MAVQVGPPLILSPPQTSWLLRVPSRLVRLGGKEAGMDEGGSEVGAKERNGASKAGWETEQRGQEAEEKEKKKTTDKDARPSRMEGGTGGNM